MNTVQIDISESVWIDVTNGANVGLITNNSQHSIRYRFSDIQPTANDSFGHVLHPNEETSFDITDDFRLWALGFAQDARIALTKDYNSAKLVNAEATLIDVQQSEGNTTNVRVYDETAISLLVLAVDLLKKIEFHLSTASGDEAEGLS